MTKCSTTSLTLLSWTVGPFARYTAWVGIRYEINERSLARQSTVDANNNSGAPVNGQTSSIFAFIASAFNSIQCNLYISLTDVLQPTHVSHYRRSPYCTSIGLSLCVEYINLFICSHRWVPPPPIFSPILAIFVFVCSLNSHIKQINIDLKGGALRLSSPLQSIARIPRQPSSNTFLFPLFTNTDIWGEYYINHL